MDVRPRPLLMYIEKEIRSAAVEIDDVRTSFVCDVGAVNDEGDRDRDVISPSFYY